MSDAQAGRWVERYARALAEGSGVSVPDSLTASGSAELLLAIARDVAHGTERRNAPLATAVVGSYVTLRLAQGADVETALREAGEVAARLSL